MLITTADLGPGVLYIIVERPDRTVLIVNRRSAVDPRDPYPEMCQMER